MLMPKVFVNKAACDRNAGFTGTFQPYELMTAFACPIILLHVQ